VGAASPTASTRSVARAALREGLNTLPAAHLDGPELDLRLLVDHRERLVRQRVAINNTLQSHLHDLWPSCDCREARSSTANGARASPVGSPRPNRPCASGSRAVNCAGSAS
jgi:hypothetical protein